MLIVVLFTLKRHHDNLHEGLDRDMGRWADASAGGGRSSLGSRRGSFLLCLCRGVNSHVTGQLIRAREPLLTGQERALMRTFASVGANVTGLMFKTVEGFRADVALVRAGCIRSASGQGSGRGLALLLWSGSSVDRGGGGKRGKRKQ